MCVSAPKPPKVEPPAPPPAPPEAAPTSPSLNDGRAEKSEDDAIKAKRRGRRSLRIDLQTGGTSNGLNIPAG